MRYAFLDFELDDELFELRAHGEVVATQARVFGLIHYLLQHRGRVVSKPELMNALWKDTVVGEAALSQVVMLARKTLRDEGETQHIIKTVRSRGFRFMPEVRQGSLATSPPVTSARPAQRVAFCVEPQVALYGRGRELAALMRHFERLEQGGGGLVLIAGEPGIGKTSLARAFARQVAASGAQVSWGRAWEEGGAPPFWPWIQVLRAIAQGVGVERLRKAAARSAPELFALLPELAVAVPVPPAPDSDAPSARFRQFDAIARVLKDLSDRDSDCARVIILDDLHAVDDASLQLLRFLQPDLSGLSLLIVGTFRELDLAQGSALSALVESCSSDARLRLRGLAADAAAQLVESNLGRAPAPRDREALYDLSGGNPLLLASLCQRLEADTAHGLSELSQLAAFALPERIVNAVRKRLADLDAQTLDALSAASAFGREFSVPLLAALSDRTETALLELLEPALRRGLIQPATNGVALLSFSHAMICHTVYSDLMPARRCALHRQIAELLERSYPAAHLPLYELAHHYYRAAADGCRTQAISYASRAAREAAGMGAFEVAAGLYERAFALGQLEPNSSELGHELLCSAGNAWYTAGELERAAGCFDRAADLALAEQHAERFAWGVVLGATAVRGGVLHDGSRRARIQQALSMLPEADSEIRALTLGASVLGLPACTQQERREVSERAVAMARRIASPYALHWVLNAQHGALWGVAPAEELLPIAEEIIALARQTGEIEVQFDGMLWRMNDCGELGNHDLAMAYREEYTQLAQRCGSPWHRYMAFGSQFFFQFGTGHFERAAEISEQTRLLGMRVREPLAEGFHAIRMLFLRVTRDLPPTEPIEPPACVPAEYRVFWILAAAAAGDRRAARAALHTALARDSEGGLLDALRRPTLAVLGQVAAWIGDPDSAAQVYERLASEAGLHLTLQPWVYLGPVNYYLGVLAVAMRDAERARVHLERALADNRVSPVFEAFTRFEYGRCCVSSGDNRRAREQFEAAAVLAEGCGMEPLRARVRDALASLAASPVAHS